MSDASVKAMKAFAAMTCSFAALFASPANAQFPNKPITLVMPYPAGSSTDGLARSVAATAGNYSAITGL